jgi:D-alanyl-D-alanine carboxypeptidase
MINFIQKIQSQIQSLDFIPAFQIHYADHDDTFTLHHGHTHINSRRTIGPYEKWHIGSCGKAFTAFIASQLVKEGILKYNDKLIQHVTLADLLCHCSGIPNQYPNQIWQDLFDLRVSDCQKRELIFSYWNKIKLTKNSGYCYSNWNYLVVAHAMTQKTGISYQELIDKYIKHPLSLPSLGYGPPPINTDSTTTPWGHSGSMEQLTPHQPSPIADNPSFFSPAGGLHISIRDWARFVDMQMQLAMPPTLPPISTPIDTTRNYLVTGWVQESVHKDLVYYHNGSNGLWSSIATFIPSKNSYWLMVANSGLSETMSALEQANQMILQAKLNGNKTDG